jgi:hypothetical protein
LQVDSAIFPYCAGIMNSISPRWLGNVDDHLDDLSRLVFGGLKPVILIETDPVRTGGTCNFDSTLGAGAEPPAHKEFDEQKTCWIAFSVESMVKA